MTQHHHSNTIFISDVHLGTRACKDKSLLHFLEHHSCDTLFLVGDIFDIWAMKRKFYWNDTQNQIVSNILKRAKKGTRVIFIPGNHDETLRQFIGESFGTNIEIHDEFVFVHPSSGKSYLVTHGDSFDFVIQKQKWLAELGSILYDWSVVVNGATNRVRKFFGLPYWSLSGFLKRQVKSASSYIDSFMTAATDRCREEGFDGIICGHIHAPKIKEIKEGLAYLNCGDWTESCSAIMLKHETSDFELKFFDNK